MLVVRQTCQVHLEVARLLDTIRTIAKVDGTNAQPPMRKRPPPKPAGATRGMGGGMGGMGGGKGGGGGMFSVGGDFRPETETKH